jgi:YHS domain-containing protein
LAESRDLGERIEAELEAAERRLAEYQAEAGRRFQEMRERHGRFLEISRRILEAGDRPLAKLASYFDNAEVTRGSDHEGWHAVVRFKHTPRYPASVELRFDLTHDEEVRRLVVQHRVQILPVFLEFDHGDQLVRDLEGIDEDEVAAWIDDKIVEFVKTYLRLPFADAYQRENLVTDPVAGVRFGKSLAKATVEYHGHTYFFVSEETKKAFEEDPEMWVHG